MSSVTGKTRQPAGSVAFVGAGPGNEALLTLRGAELLAGADTVVLDRSRYGALLRHCRDDVETIDTGDYEPADRDRLAVGAARSGKTVVRLFGGDPGLFCHASSEATACAKAHVPFEIVPGVPAAAGVLAYAGIPLAEPGSGEVRIVDATSPHVDWEEQGRFAETLVVYNGFGELAQIVKALVAAGKAESTPIAVIQAGTTTEQKSVAAALGTVLAEVKASGLTGPALIVVGDVVRLRDTLSWFETKPLFGWRVLVPRTKEQADAVSEQLRSYGAVPEQVPTISVEPPRTPQQMDRAIRGLVTGRYEWVAFTSTNAVRAVRGKFEEYGLDARAFAGLKVAAVGEQTAATLVAFGIKPDLIPSGEQSSEGLVAEFPPYDPVLDPINRVLLPRADIATETLAGGLTELGWEVDDVTVYRTVRAAPPPAPIREAIKGGSFDAVLFTSSSTVRNLIGIGGKPHPTTVVAVIGPQTAKTAEEMGLRVDVMAGRPSARDLVVALAEYGARHRLAALEAGEPVRRPSQLRRGARRRAK